GRLVLGPPADLVRSCSTRERWSMTPPDRNCQRVPAARPQSREALGARLELFRAYLLQVAHEHLGPRLAAKGDAADLVQETFLEACRDVGSFEGVSDADLRACRPRLLLTTPPTLPRRFRDGGKRALDREVPLEADDPGGTTLTLASEDSTPSGHFA